MGWSPPAGVVPVDRKSPSVAEYGDIPAMLDWLRIYYPSHTVVGTLVTARNQLTTYRVDGEPGYGTPGTLSNYTLTKVDWGRTEVDAALADVAQHLLENTVYASDTADDPPLPSPYRAGIRGRKVTETGNVLYLVTAPAETPGWLPTQELLSGDAVAAVEAAAADARVAAGEATAAIGGIAGLRLIEAAEGLTAPDGTPLVLAAVDDNGATPFYVDAQGRTHLHEVQAGGMVTRTNPDTGLPWALTDNAERMAAWATSAGEFDVARPGPNLRMAARFYQYLICAGDSTVQGLGTSGFVIPPGIDATPGAGYPRELQRLLLAAGFPVTVINRGSSSATALDIAARIVGGGGVAAQFGVTALAGGTYALRGMTDASPLLTPSGATQHQRGHLGEAAGTLYRDNSPADWQSSRRAYYTFVPDAGQPSLEVSPDPAAPRRVYQWRPEPVHPHQPMIIRMGRNNAGDPAQTVTALRAMLGALPPEVPRLVIGVLAMTTESWGNGREAIEVHNRAMAEVAGRAFLDANEILCRNPDGSIRADGTPWPGYMADSTHENDLGVTTLVTQGVMPRIQSERWFN